MLQATSERWGQKSIQCAEATPRVLLNIRSCPQHCFVYRYPWVRDTLGNSLGNIAKTDISTLKHLLGGHFYMILSSDHVCWPQVIIALFSVTWCCLESIICMLTSSHYCFILCYIVLSSVHHMYIDLKSSLLYSLLHDVVFSPSYECWHQVNVPLLPFLYSLLHVSFSPSK